MNRIIFSIIWLSVVITQVYPSYSLGKESEDRFITVTSLKVGSEVCNEVRGITVLGTTNYGATRVTMCALMHHQYVRELISLKSYLFGFIDCFKKGKVLYDAEGKKVATVLNFVQDGVCPNH